MTSAQWGTQYARLTTGYGKKEDEGQMDAYFSVLGEYGIASVESAVTKALAESKFFPKVAELVGFVHAYRHAHQAPAAVCDVCGGTRFTVTNCDGKQLSGERGDAHRPLVAVNPFAAYVCGRDFVHPAHEDAHPCGQCHPLGIKARRGQHDDARRAS